MTAEEFRKKYWQMKLDVPFAEDFDTMLATVRDEARREALEEAAATIERDRWTSAGVIIRKMIMPPRTLDDVLAYVDKYLASPGISVPEETLCNIARTAVEGLRRAEREALSNRCRGVVAETVDKLTEIR